MTTVPFSDCAIQENISLNIKTDFLFNFEKPKIYRCFYGCGVYADDGVRSGCRDVSQCASSQTLASQDYAHPDDHILHLS